MRAQEVRGRTAPAPGPLPARDARADRHARRLRHVQLRGVHGPPQRRGRQVLHAARRPGRRRRGQDDRGNGPRKARCIRSRRPSGSTTACSAATARPGMIMAAADLLAAQPEPHRGRGPRGARGQPLPLHRLPQHRQGRAGRREAGAARARRCRHERHRAPRRPATATSGGSMQRKEDPRLIMGRARYVDDINVTGQLWAAFVRSPEAHAKIVSIDTSAAKAYDGRRRRLHRRGPRPRGAAADGLGPAGDRRQQPAHWALAKDEVKHVGDPVALVIGEDRYAVVDAAEDGRRRVRPAAGRHRHRGGARGRLAARPRAVRHQQGATSGRSAAAISRPASPRPTSSSSVASSTTARRARRSSRAACSPTTAPAG